MTAETRPGTDRAASGEADAAKVRFTEEMKGYAALGESDFERGYRRGREHGTRLIFHLTIEVEDIDRFSSDPMREAAATGWVRCEELGGKLPVERGVFNLFVDTERSEEKRMLYRLHFSDGVGHPLTLTGYKVIADDPGFDMWRDTTTLYTRVLKGHTEAGDDDRAEVVAAGILRISPPAFARQLTTFRASGASVPRTVLALARFNVLFLGQLWKLYGLRPAKRKR